MLALDIIKKALRRVGKREMRGTAQQPITDWTNDPAAFFRDVLPDGLELTPWQQAALDKFSMSDMKEALKPGSTAGHLRQAREIGGIPLPPRWPQTVWDDLDPARVWTSWPPGAVYTYERLHPLPDVSWRYVGPDDPTPECYQWHSLDDLIPQEED